ncbi:MAG: SMC-Scp complex subunit ScpB [Bacilli bacterium]
MKKGVLEGLLFIVGEEGLSLDEIENILELDKKEGLQLIEEYKKDLLKEDRGIKLVYLGNKYKLSTKEEHKSYYEALADKTMSGSLSQASLETLAIIAYNGPISVGQIDEYRGVLSREMVRKLLFRGLIEISGRSQMPGRPMLYKTNNKFLDYFNLSSIDELPVLEVKEDEEDKDLFLSKYKDE